MTPSLTLVIPSFNRAAMIADTIDAALAQTVPFAEIIVVDDGSTDDTAAVLARYTGRITVLRLPNGGPQLARNAGVHAATTPYITLCDSDDILAPAFVATMQQHLQRHPETDSIYSNFHTFTDDEVYPDKLAGANGKLLAGSTRAGDFATKIPDLYLRTVAYQALFPSGATFRRAFYQRIGGFSPLFFRTPSEDWEFTLRAIAYGKTAYCTRALVYIQKHPGNQSADSTRQTAGTITILEYALRHHPMPAFYRATIRKSIAQRRLQVFESAFAAGKFDMAQEQLQHMPRKPTALRFRIKQFIARLPRLVRQPLWTLTQAN